MRQLRPKTPAPPKGPAAYHQLAQVLRDLETDLNWGLHGSPRIPRAWHQIAQARVQPAKDKVTLRVDSDVLAFFRAMGTGYLTRMNDVLRAFMLARLAGLLPGLADYQPGPEEEPLTEQEKRFFELLDMLKRSSLNDAERQAAMMRHMEMEREGRA